MQTKKKRPFPEKRKVKGLRIYDNGKEAIDEVVIGFMGHFGNFQKPQIEVLTALALVARGNLELFISLYKHMIENGKESQKADDCGKVEGVAVAQNRE